MSLVAKTRLALRHPAPNTPAAAVLTRLALWRARTALGMGTTVPIADSSLRFWCPAEWRGNAKMTYVWRDEYESELAQLHRWVRRGDSVVDVGAHYGVYTLALTRLVGDEGRVIAVEPARHARAVLNRNLRINGLNMVQVLPVAAGAEPAMLPLQGHSDRSRASLRAHQTALAGAVSTATTDAKAAELVEVVRIDDIIPPDRRISLLKMDVEGYEPQALEGAKNLLTRDRPVVIFEFLPGLRADENPGTEPPALRAWRFLADLGYRMHQVTEAGEVIQVDSPAQRRGCSPNVVAIHPASGRASAAVR